MGKDSKLIKRLKRKSLEAFDIVYHQYKNLVFYRAYSVLNNKEDAEDVTQQTFIKFMENIEGVDDDSSIKQLLSRMAENEAIDLYRRKTKRASATDEMIDSISTEDLNDAELTITLNKVLEVDEASIVALKVVYDYTFQEIADETKETLGTIQGKYYKAIKKLKDYYKEKEK